MGKLWEKMKKGKAFTSFRSLKTRMFCMIVAAGIVPCIVLHVGILERYLDNTIATVDAGEDYRRSSDYI